MRSLIPGYVLLCAALLFIGGCDAVRPAPGAEAKATVEVAVFEGGYGIDWHQRMAKRYNAEQAPGDVQINLWGDPRVVEQVKPRILRGNPPDLMIIHDLPVWQMILADRLLPFDEVLAQPAFGSDTPWGELFVPGTLDFYRSEGSVYAIPSAFGAWSCWYDARMFREHGWEVPTTWEEFEALCEEMLAAGIAPLAYQGKYPLYGWWTFTAMIQRYAGLAGINRINALEPGAFSHPEVVQAAAQFQRLGTQYMQRGALAMTHTESQLQFLNGHAAMIFCGVWLYNEMKEVIPDGFEMRCFSLPAAEGGRGNPRLFSGEGAEFFYVSADARHPEAAFDFSRYLVSPVNAPDMGASIGVISPLVGGTPREAVPPPLQSVLDMIDAAEGIYNVRLHLLLLGWRFAVMEPNVTALLRGDLTPEQFCANLDAGIARALEDPDIIVPPHIPVDPAKYGEAP